MLNHLRFSKELADALKEAIIAEMPLVLKINAAKKPKESKLPRLMVVMSIMVFSIT
jgi:2,4-dienoyl-CoA reductase-like NADH-dependent reductase (Old Yellow Enzyme family)